MGDDNDIVKRLDEAYESLCDIGGATERDVVLAAKNEIERLRAELDEERNRRQDDLVGNAWMEEYTNRMRTAGDGLAEWVQDNGPGSTEDMTLLAQWNQARRP